MHYFLFSISAIWKLANKPFEPEVPPKSRELPNTGANELKVVVKAVCYNDAEDQWGSVSAMSDEWCLKQHDVNQRQMPGMEGTFPQVFAKPAAAMR
jgi:hypothetical protein